MAKPFKKPSTGNNKPTGYTYFVETGGIQNAGYTFTGYVDRDGIHQFIDQGTDARGNQLYRRFKFSPAQRMLSIPNSQQDVINFLRNHPECYGSPNGFYVDDGQGGYKQSRVRFKEMNEEKDADIGIEAMAARAEATSVALSLNKPENAEELVQMATLCGSPHVTPKLALFHIMKYAENSPVRFMEIYNDPSRKVRFIAKKGIDSGVFTVKGNLIMWHDITLGFSQDDIVKKLLLDKELLAGVEKEIADLS